MSSKVHEKTDLANILDNYQDVMNFDEVYLKLMPKKIKIHRHDQLFMAANTKKLLLKNQLVQSSVQYYQKYLCSNKKKVDSSLVKHTHILDIVSP